MNFTKKIFVRFIKNKKINFLSRGNIVFLTIIMGLMIVMSPSSVRLKWIGLSLAMFSTMANDSIQTLGTFLTSNTKVAWWKLWLYISGLFILVVALGWFKFSGSLDFGRLQAIPYDPHFDVMHFVAPVLLIFLTYNKIPASTTFLILSVFSSQNMVTFMLIKTFIGYILAFIFSFILWNVLAMYFNKLLIRNDADLKRKRWKFFQWASTGLLWMAWLTQNTVNIVVYTPRHFNFYELCLFLFLGIIMIGFTFYNRGGPIQQIVSEKKDMNNVRSTTMINLCFAFIIIFMSLFNNVPMATTWVFIGVLAGRELSMAKYDNDTEIKLVERYRNARGIILKDLISAALGITISLIFSMINSTF